MCIMSRQRQTALGADLLEGSPAPPHPPWLDEDATAAAAGAFLALIKCRFLHQHIE
jgi:hypothetical protein